MAFNPQDIQKANFDAVIKLASDQARKFKDNPDKSQKYEDEKKKLQQAKAKLEKIVEDTKNIKMTSGKTFYEEFVDGREHLVSLFYLSQQIEKEKSNGTIDIQATVANKVDIDKISFDVPEVETTYDMVDQTKSLGKQILNGTGASKWLTRGCFGVMIGELLSKGITGALVKEGIMAESMGLFGVAKLGIVEGLPALWSALSTGVTTLAGFSPLMLGVGATALALIAVPMVKKLVDKVKTKHKNEVAFDQGVQKILTAQEATNLQP